MTEPKKAAVLDIETYPNFMLISIKLIGEDRLVNYIFDETRTPDWNRLRTVLRKYTIITFNGNVFDMPIVFLAMDGATVSEIKEASNRVITTGLKPWNVWEALGVYKPKWLDTIDLIEPNPAVMQGLKVLNGRLHGPWMQELPYPHDKVLTDEEKDFVVKYCRNDLDATERLYLALQEPLEIRAKVSADLDMDVRSKSDTQMGTTIIKKRIEDASGKRIPRTDPQFGIGFRYQIPDFIKFETPQLQAILDRIRDHEFTTKADGKVDLPKWLSDEKIVIGPSTFQMGIGGLHSTESNRSVLADDQNAIVSVDVSSYYPASILSLGLYPHAVGKEFLSVYRGIRDARITAKKAGDKVFDKTYKICLNGTFGVLGSRYSFMYAPHLLIAVTLTGQLALLMLIERAFLRGIPSISANTDGVEFLCPRSMYAGLTGDRINPCTLADVTEGWERDTEYVLEAMEYTALYNQSVNSYIALKADGSHKRKGPIANPWSKEKSDHDPRGQMMKNPQAPICSDAVLYFLKHGTPIEQTIRECEDVRCFVTVVNATGGATWAEPRGWKYVDDWVQGWGKNHWLKPGDNPDHGGVISETRPAPYRVEVLGDQETYLGKVVRYYWSTNGAPIIKMKAHPTTGNRPKVSKTDGCRPLMTLPDDFAVPDDLDYSRYIAEAENILRDIGYYNREIAEKLSPWQSNLRLASQLNVK